jgi:hypothetical protein
LSRYSDRQERLDGLGVLVDSLPAEIKGQIAAERATLDAMIKELRMTVDVSKFDFVPRIVRHYSMSSAASSIRDLLKSSRGNDVVAADDAGLDVRDTYWLATQEKLEYDTLSAFSAEGALAGLNEHAEKFGAGKVARERLTDDLAILAAQEMALSGRLVWTSIRRFHHMRHIAAGWFSARRPDAHQSRRHPPSTVD